MGGTFLGLPPAVFGQLQLGDAPGAVLSVSGSFTGGDGEANSVATIAATQSLGEITALCRTTTGVEALNIGTGTLTLQ